MFTTTSATKIVRPLHCIVTSIIWLYQMKTTNVAKTRQKLVFPILPINILRSCVNKNYRNISHRSDGCPISSEVPCFISEGGPCMKQVSVMFRQNTVTIFFQIELISFTVERLRWKIVHSWSCHTCYDTGPWFTRSHWRLPHPLWSPLTTNQGRGRGYSDSNASFRSPSRERGWPSFCSPSPTRVYDVSLCLCEIYSRTIFNQSIN